MADRPPGQRLDKWLWQARFFKSRSLAARIVSDGGVRVDGTRIVKPARAVAPGETLTFAQGRTVRVIRILALATRRGPAAEAQSLYEDLAPPGPATPRVGPRPTKKDRRKLMESRPDPVDRDGEAG